MTVVTREQFKRNFQELWAVLRYISLQNLFAFALQVKIDVPVIAYYCCSWKYCVHVFSV